MKSESSQLSMNDRLVVVYMSFVFVVFVVIYALLVTSTWSSFSEIRGSWFSVVSLSIIAGAGDGNIASLSKGDSGVFGERFALAQAVMSSLVLPAAFGFYLLATRALRFRTISIPFGVVLTFVGLAMGWWCVGSKDFFSVGDGHYSGLLRPSSGWLSLSSGMWTCAFALGTGAAALTKKISG